MNALPVWGLRAAALLALVLAPQVLSGFNIILLGHILIFGLLAASLDLLVGFTGLPSLGHALFFGIGGYSAGLMATKLTNNAFAQLGIAVVAAAAIAAGTGWLAVRTRGVYFLMLTLAFAELLFSLALTWTSVTGGANGLRVPILNLWPGFRLRGEDRIYYYMLFGFLLGYVLLRLVVGSPFGRALVGIRENEARMRAVGYSVVGYKLGAFCIAGAVGGFAGALFVQHDRFISPTNVSFEISALTLIMVIMGGVGTLYGPVLGAAVVILFRDKLSTEFGERWDLILGIIFVLFVYFLPRGIGGLAKTISRRLAGGRVPEPLPDTAAVEM